MANFNWECPHCNKSQTVTEKRYSVEVGSVGVDGLAEGVMALMRQSVGCSNPECLKLTMEITVGADAGGQTWRIDPNKILFRERILPRGASKPQPDFIPVALKEDYYEACLIKDLSPKASATLTRRCLQGMIRDFAGISKSRLVDEISALRSAVENNTVDRSVTVESVDAIDHVRSIGNIGAHMEREINSIVPVDPGEAQALIELVEMLFDEWYGARERRKARLERISNIAGDKNNIKLALSKGGSVSS